MRISPGPCSIVCCTILAGACIGEDPSLTTTPVLDAGADAVSDPPDAKSNAPDAGPGGECTQPCDFATGQSQPYAIVVDTTHVYWTNRAVPGAVLRKPKAGSETIETLAAGQDAPTGLAVTPAYVYWLTTSPPRVARRALSGTAPESGPAAVEKPQWLAVANARIVYTGESSGGGTRRGLHSVSDVLDAPNVHDADIDARALAVDAPSGRTYYARYSTTAGELRVLDADGTIKRQAGITSDVVDWKGISAITVGDEDVYWTALDGVFRQSKATFGVPDAYANAVSPIADARGIVFDIRRKRAFFVTESGGVYSAEGSAVTKIGETPCEAQHLAQDETSLYWTCGSLGTVKRMRKP